MTDILLAQTSRRLQVLDLRRRIEIIAITAQRDAFLMDEFPRRTHISNRLACLLVARKATLSADELVPLVRLARTCYKRTSDILHGRASLVGVSQAQIDEWQSLVEKLEIL